MEYTTAPYAPLDSGPSHPIFRYSDGLWIVIKPLEDSTVQNFFGAYPSLSLHARKLDKLNKDPDLASDDTIPQRQGAQNWSRYIFGQLKEVSLSKFKGFSYMAQYTQGPGDHSLKNEDLSWTCQGLIYLKYDRAAFVVQAAMPITHNELEAHRPEVGATDEECSLESKALDKLGKDGFSPSVESAVTRIATIITLIEQGGAEQPATAPESKPKGNEKSKLESEVRSQ